MFNRYRNRSYAISKTRARAYAKEMENLKNSFLELQKDGWNISSHLDSCYKRFDGFELRLSNHSANNQYHDLENGELIINIKKSKLDFASFIKNDLAALLKKINELDLEKYRFINVVDSNINCYVKGYKTKKDVF